MRHYRRMPKLDAEHGRALAPLACRTDGCTEAVLLARGFMPELITDLVRAGLATSRPKRMIVVGNAVSVTRIKVTESGREVAGNALGAVD